MNEAIEIPPLEGDDPIWRRAEEEDDFWEEHQEVFREEYPDRFVVVADGQVVFTSPDLEDVLSELRTQGRDIHDVWIRYIFRDPSTMML
jgi:hypothetical protein